MQFSLNEAFLDRGVLNNLSKRLWKTTNLTDHTWLEEAGMTTSVFVQHFIPLYFKSKTESKFIELINFVSYFAVPLKIQKKNIYISIIEKHFCDEK